MVRLTLFRIHFVFWKNLRMSSFMVKSVHHEVGWMPQEASHQWWYISSSIRYQTNLDNLNNRKISICNYLTIEIRIFWTAFTSRFHVTPCPCITWLIYDAIEPKLRWHSCDQVVVHQFVARNTYIRFLFALVPHFSVDDTCVI